MDESELVYKVIRGLTEDDLSEKVSAFFRENPDWGLRGGLVVVCDNDNCIFFYQVVVKAGWEG